MSTSSTLPSGGRRRRRAPSRFVAQVRSVLRAHRMRTTTQRLRMLQALADSPVPLSVERLHEAIAGRCDLVTVYRSIGALHEIGLVRKLYAFDGTVLYMSGIGQASYAVLPRIPGPGIMLPPAVAEELTVATQRAVEHLAAAGFRNVQPLVQFFCDPTTE